MSTVGCPRCGEFLDINGHCACNDIDRKKLALWDEIVDALKQTYEMSLEGYALVDWSRVKDVIERMEKVK